MSSSSPDLILPSAVASALHRWDVLGPSGWLEVRWVPQAESLPTLASFSPQPLIRPSSMASVFPSAWPSALEDQILASLSALDREARRSRSLSSIHIRCWRLEASLRLVISAQSNNRPWAECCWSCHAALGGAPRRHRRLRPILPAEPPHAPRPWDELERSSPIGLLLPVRDGSWIEQFRLLQRRLSFPGLWTTASPRLARLWLAHHPGCPLFAAVVGVPASQLHLTSPTFSPGSAPLIVALPTTTTELLAAARKICRRQLGNAA